MPEEMTASFLDGHGIPVELPKVEDELVKLWGPAAVSVGGPDLETPHVTRVALANLVVESLDQSCASLAPVLETVIARYPCRAIVMRHSHDPERRITAEVSALCHLPAPGMPQVCSERIVLRAGPNALDLVPGAVRPLLEADLPMILWWNGDPRAHDALYRDLADESARVILDLPDPGTSGAAIRIGLDASVCPSTRDSAWFAVTRWRELIAQFFDPECHHDSLKWLRSVRIEVFSPDPTRAPRLAIWLAAWLAGQLGWKPQGRPARSGRDGGSVVRAEFVGASGTVAIEIVTRQLPANLPVSPRLFSVLLSAHSPAGVTTFRLSRPEPGSPAVRIEVGSSDSCRLPRLVEAPDLDPARRIAAALESSRTDIPFQNARPIALWLLEQNG
jgi:glucose-6-phosphate dehydrogenase assembly protein OpcA